MVGEYNRGHAVGLAVTLKNYWSGWRYCKRYVHIVVHIVQRSFFLKKNRFF